MAYVELHRAFAPVKPDHALDVEVGRYWGHKIAGWFGWPELLERSRVILLAEASSGKTTEFRNQATCLASEGRSAFFARIEDLADDGLESALDPPAVAAFSAWRDAGDQEGWFFLDSVDEARLNHKTLERALRHFVKELCDGRDRARVYVSCRVSDWKGEEDLATIERLLPAPRPVSLAPVAQDQDAALLGPIFGGRRQVESSVADGLSQPAADAILMVQLVPLGKEQWRVYALAEGIQAAGEFADAIERHDLTALAERPGDLLDLVGYWQHHGHFGSLSEMTRQGVARKLSEMDSHRSDNRDLSDSKAADGAARLAAALILTKGSSLKAPDHPTLQPGALDPAAVLPEWTPAERNALLRRGIFAPATYGRVRFHHRSTQEYLAAQWLSRLLKTSPSRSTILELVFTECYGVQVVVPSFHAAGAWLAVDHPDVLDEVIRRDPYVLLRHGDPGALSLEARKRLLRSCARHHAAAEVADDTMDRARLAPLATPELAETIRECWAINQRNNFRADLLYLIGDGSIQACADLVRPLVAGGTAPDYLRIAALRALAACGDTVGVAGAIRWLMDCRNESRAAISVAFCRILFPRYLSVEGLLQQVARFPEADPGTLWGFGHELLDLWSASPDSASRDRLLGGIADLCFSPPRDAGTHISTKYRNLAENLTPLARAAIGTVGNGGPSHNLIRLLMATERVEPRGLVEHDAPSLSALVTANPAVNQALFWADVQTESTSMTPGQQLTMPFWRLFAMGKGLWHLEVPDLDWIYAGLRDRPSLPERRLILRAAVEHMSQAGQLKARESTLREAVSGDARLLADLDTYLSPPQLNPEFQEHQRRQEQRRQAANKREERDKDSWRTFQEELMSNPEVLRDPARLASWQTGAFRLWHLTKWLAHKTSKPYDEAALQWPLLAEGFGLAVSQAYRDGMRTIWRYTPPERPKSHKGSGRQTKYTTIMAYAGLGIEAREDPDWATKLDSDEATRAAQHACLSELGYPRWIEDLIDRHQEAVRAVLRDQLRTEWSGRYGSHGSFLAHFSRTDRSIPQPIQELLVGLCSWRKPRDAEVLEKGLRILQRLELTDLHRRSLVRLARRRWRAPQDDATKNLILHYAAMLFLLDPDEATARFAKWLVAALAEARDTRALGAISFLFGRDSGFALQALSSASVSSLMTLARLAYSHIRPEDDLLHEGGYTPGERDIAERARNAIFDALRSRPGVDAFKAIQALAASSTVPEALLRLRELAREKAVRDAEPPPWLSQEVLDFERSQTAPVKTCESLLRVVMGVLGDIQDSFSRSDASSHNLLERADSEEVVQEWLAEQLNLRSRGRFHAHREPQVADQNKPDIIVSSTAAQVEVAIECKHSGLGWSVRKLEAAIEKQLVRQYLRPLSRRAGVLVVSHHGKRSWRDPDTRAPLCFAEVIQRLQRLAATIGQNEYGCVEARVFGLDTCPSPGKMTEAPSV